VILDDPETSGDPIPEEDFEGYEGFYGDEEDSEGFATSAMGQSEGSQGRLTPLTGERCFHILIRRPEGHS
jgi:hypothetical protein